MKAGKQELIFAELKRAEESFSMAKIAVGSQFWNSAAGELYYACFHLIQTLFVRYDIQAHTHSGLKSLFAGQFVKEGKIDGKWGKLVARLFEYRQRGYYGDYKVSENDILPVVKEVEEFKKIVLDLLEQEGYKTNNES